MMQKKNELEKNLLICGDNLNALDDLIKKGIRADLIYLDPPFFSKRHYEVVWGDEAEVRSFKDRWAGGINVYIEWMRERIVKAYELLKSSGSLYLHCDWHAGHYLKVMLDEVFGYENFRNEIIWHYSGWNRHGEKHFNRRYDQIYFYAKSDRSKFYSYAIPWESKGEYVRLRKQKIHTDKEGREYVLSDAGGGKRVRRYLIEAMKDGKPIDDVWDIDKINNSSKERTGYPTQKPEAILERIIKASSKKNDLIIDPFCGCGTTLSVAQLLGRRWIGIDISTTAIRLVEKRMVKRYGVNSGKDFDVIGMPTTISALRELAPVEFQNWVVNKMGAKHSKRFSSDFGLDGFYDKSIFTERAGIQVKQSENVGRNVVDNFETALSRGKFEKGFIVAFSFTRGAHEEAARVKGEGVEIRLIEVEDLLLGKVKI